MNDYRITICWRCGSQIGTPHLNDNCRYEDEDYEEIQVVEAEPFKRAVDLLERWLSEDEDMTLEADTRELLNDL